MSGENMKNCKTNLKIRLNTQKKKKYLCNIPGTIGKYLNIFVQK